MSRRAIALLPSTLTTRARVPKGKVSSEPDSLAFKRGLSFLRNLFPLTFFTKVIEIEK